MDNRLNKDGLYLALGGGAARGLAHLGILKALEKHKIPVAGICGTSMGAMIGATYALAPDAEHVTKDFVDYVHSTHYERARYSFMRNAQKREKESRSKNFLKKLEHGLMLGRAVTTGSFISYENYKREICSLVPDKTFKDTAIPFFAVAVDLVNQQEVVFDQGLLRSAVMASAAIPGAFPAVKSGSYTYVDGGWMNKVPVNPLIYFGARKVVAVDVFHKPPSEFNPKRGYSILTKANQATEARLLQLQIADASILWRPPVHDLHWAEFTQIEKAVEVGFNFADARMDEIKRLLEPDPKPKWWVRRLEKLLPEKPPRPAPRDPVQVRGIYDVLPIELEK